MSNIPLPRTVFVGPDGKPLAGGLVTVYLAGTTTLGVTYSDLAQTQANSNPIRLDSAGSAAINGAGNFTFSVVDALGRPQPGMSGQTSSSAGYVGVLGINPAQAPFGAAGNGVVDDYTALKAADTAAVAAGVPLLIFGDYKIGTNLTLGSQLVFLGGQLQPSVGVTVTIAGAMAGSLVKLFGGAGSVVFAAGAVPPEVYPEWWGAGHHVYSTAAFQSAVNSLAGFGGVIQLSAVEYYWQNGPVNVSSGCVFRGAGIGFTGGGLSVAGITTVDTTADMFDISGTQGVKFQDIAFRAIGGRAGGFAISVGAAVIIRASTGTGTSGGVIPMSNTTGIVVGMGVAGTGLVDGAGIPIPLTVQAVTANTSITLYGYVTGAAVNASTVASGTVLSFVQLAQSPEFEDCSFAGFVNCLGLSRASHWVVTGCVFTLWTGVAIYHPMNEFPDTGDSYLTDCTFVGNYAASNGTVPDSAVYTESSLGLYITGNKFYGGKYGIKHNARLVTGTLLCTGNSFEDQTASSVLVLQSGSTAAVGNIGIVNNEFSKLHGDGPTGPVIYISAGASQYVTNVIISNNIHNHSYNVAAAAIAIGDGNGVIVSNNVINFYSQPLPTAIQVLGNATKVQIMDNNFIGMAVSQFYGNGLGTNVTVLRDSNGMTGTLLPVSLANGSQVYVTDGTAGTPLTGGGTGSMAFRINGAWKGI